MSRTCFCDCLPLWATRRNCIPRLPYPPRCGAVLSLSGYIPDVVQTPQALLGIRLLLGPVPAAIFVLALITLYCYPINEARYNEILEGIKEMESKSS